MNADVEVLIADTARRKFDCGLRAVGSPLDQDRQVAAELPGLVKRLVSRPHLAE